MKFTARPYQLKFKTDIYGAWAAGARNVIGVLPTGGGKTFTFSEIVKECTSPAAVIAHRQELVVQISLALARDEIPHRIIGPTAVVRLANGVQMDELGRSFYHPKAPVAVAGVDTLIRRQAELAVWMRSVGLWVIDEAHHVVRGNKWGAAVEMFPNARGLGVTATPIRLDGRGLGRHADGVFNAMIEGPTMRELISAGYLTDYRIFAPPSDLDLSVVKISATSGEYNPDQLRQAVKKSHVIGDVVAHYLKIAPGKLGVTFAPSVDIAGDIATRFNASGVPAAVVSADTPDHDRVSILRRFKTRQLMQLVNVDLFGEGFDLPAIEVISMARPTQSFSLYAQQFGRPLRIMLGKKTAIIIDHVGNVARHGLPDARRVWSLDTREKRSRDADLDAIPVTTCLACFAVYERFHATCPFCGHKNQPASRAGPEYVDGDLTELDPATLAVMRGEIDRIDGPVMFPNSLAMPARMRLDRVHRERQNAQAALRASIAWWAGYQSAAGRSESESYKRFYWQFGVDVMTAQTLNARDALELVDRVNREIVKNVN